MKTAKEGMYVLVAVRAAVPFPLTYYTDLIVCVGQRVLVPLGARDVTGYIVQIDTPAPMQDIQIKDLKSIVDEEPIFSERYIQIAQWIAQMNFATLGEVLFMLGPGAQTQTTERTRLVLGEDEIEYSDVLTPAQMHALHQLQDKQGISYLFGVTGSGKTHVFLHLIRQARHRGHSVLYLVPEISLSYQTYKYLRAFFPDVTLWHSALTPAQRLRTWRAIQKGEKNIVLGTRSAILAPLLNLGLIILDEEHDTAYKSSASPRYHARQVAMYLSKTLDIPLVMGSATPSLEAYHAMQQGRIHQVSLTERASGTALPPEICVIDMRRQQGIFSPQLVREVLQTKDRGKQSILFLNRRGFARFYFCDSCGFELKCRHCSISLTYHKSTGRMLCHYCGYQQEKPSCCPQCGSVTAGFTTFGLEKAEEEAQRIFIGLRIARLDGDIARKKTELQKILKAFREGELDLLVATQIVAKGFNFPHLHLVGVLSADIGLSMPDFRAQERVFTLLTQIAGRAGRYEDKGRVLIQTSHPENPAILYSARCDIENFYCQELTARDDLEFPPYRRLLRLIFRSKIQEKSEQAARHAAILFQQNCPEDAELLGPTEAVISQIAENYRWQILLRAKHHYLLKIWVEENLPALRAMSGVYCEIDSDPVSLL